jgi:RNA polymerase sigma factor (sigma-70 family)
MGSQRYKTRIENLTDEELMDTYQHGAALAERAFEVLFNRHGGRVLMYLSGRISNRRQAEDLTQEVFLKLHRSKHLYRASLPFLPWLFTITRSVMLDHLKRQNLEDPTADLSKFDHLLVEGPQLEIAPHAALLRLPNDQGEAVRLRIYEDDTFDEIAVKLSTSPENARQLFSRGIKKLRSIFEKDPRPRTGKEDK